MKKNELNILLSCDDNYSHHLGALLWSICENNKDFDYINIFLFDNAIKEDSKKQIREIVSKYETVKLIWKSFEEVERKLNLNMTNKISISAYARLFASDIIPKDIEKVLYLDTDMIVCDSLRQLWKTDLQGKVLGAVQDMVGESVKTDVGLATDMPYFNSGLLLIDMNKWSSQNIGKKCLEFIKAHNGNVRHHDQGTLNGVLVNNWKKLPLKYNVMTIHYMFSLNQMKKYYRDHSVFYSENEQIFAKNNPVILHFTPSFTSRPWVKNCKHPLKNKYIEAINNTPWKETLFEDDKSSWKSKLLNWRYRNIKF